MNKKKKVTSSYIVIINRKLKSQNKIGKMKLQMQIEHKTQKHSSTV